MLFRKNKLILALLQAEQKCRVDIYNDLLKVWQSWIKQESVNQDKFESFWYYEPVSDNTRVFYQCHLQIDR